MGVCVSVSAVPIEVFGNRALDAPAPTPHVSHARAPCRRRPCAGRHHRSPSPRVSLSRCAQPSRPHTACRRACLPPPLPATQTHPCSRAPAAACPTHVRPGLGRRSEASTWATTAPRNRNRTRARRRPLVVRRTRRDACRERTRPGILGPCRHRRSAAFRVRQRVAVLLLPQPVGHGKGYRGCGGGGGGGGGAGTPSKID